MKTKLVVGVVGMGMGKSHTKAAMHYGAEIAAICDTNEEKLQKVGEELGIPQEKWFTDYRALAENKEINCIIIATPDQLHREMAEVFLAAGKHIMCEKPLALTREDMEAIIAATKKYNTKFMVGQICRFTPAFVKAKEIVEAGTIGELYYVESEYAHDYVKIVTDKSNWRADPVRHGVVGGGCHAVDLLRWYCGDPIEVFAYGTKKNLPEVSYDDATVALLKFSDDCMGKVFVSTGCKRDYTMRTVIYGTKGTIICDNTSPTMQLFTVDETGHTIEDPQIIELEVNNHNYDKEFEVFAEAILNDTKVLTDAREGAKTVEVCLAIVKSSETGTIVKPDYNF